MSKQCNVMVILAAAVFLIQGCAALDPNAQYDRHSYSRLSEVPDDNSALKFEARSSAAYPADDPQAEQTRMLWLQDWLEIRGLCKDGVDIEERVHSQRASDRFGYDLQYQVRCR